MEHTARNDKYMEYGMHISVDALSCDAVKHRADGITYSARKQKPKSVCADSGYRRFARQDYAPTERKVAYNRKHVILFKVDSIKRYSERRNAPDYSEHRPPEGGVRAPQRAERYWGVGSRYQNENGAMVYYLHNLFRRFGYKPVVYA